MGGGFRNRLNGTTATTQADAIRGELELLGDWLQRIASSFDRNIDYGCIGGTATFRGFEGHCRNRDASACVPTRAVLLCPGFWNLGEAGRATPLIHEMSHILWELVVHGPGMYRHASYYANFVADLFAAPLTDPPCPAP